MTKENFAVVELLSNGFGELSEIAIINVNASNGDITGVSYMKVKPEDGSIPKGVTPKETKEAYTLKEAMTVLLKMLDGRKLASHTGLDFEHVYLNRLIEKTHGITNLIERINVIDTHVLAMTFLKGVPKDMFSVANHLGVKTVDGPTALQKAYITYGIIKKMFASKAVRQHTYKYSFKAITVPEIKPVITVEKIVTTVETYTYTE